MPRGDRGEGHPNLGGYGVALAIILCTLIAGVLSYSSGRESERRNHAPASYSRAAKQDAQRACIGMDSGTAFECIYEKVEASQEQARGEQDLSAQQRAASAAAISAIIAVLTLIATGLGVWYVKRTLDATLEAVKDTSEATDAMRKANEIAYVTQRPWIEVEAEIFKFKCVGRRYIEFDWLVKFKNIGRMPAENFHSVVRCEIIGHDVLGETGFYYDQFTKNEILQDVAVIPSGEYDHFGISAQPLATIPWNEGEGTSPKCFILLIAMSKYKIPGETEWRYAMQSYSIGQNRNVVDNRSLAYDFPDDISENDMAVMRFGRRRAT